MPDRPDPVTDALPRFTPSAAGLDRDAILFAAGRRAAGGSWVWKWLVAVLGISQVVSLLVLWPKKPATQAPVSPPAVTAPAVEPPPASPVPADVWTAGSRPDVVEHRPASVTVQYVDPDRPLTVRSGLRFD
jgi:hypothetical protein